MALLTISSASTPKIKQPGGNDHHDEIHVMAIFRIRPVITERAVLRYCGKFTLATLSVMTGLIRDIAEIIMIMIITHIHDIKCSTLQMRACAHYLDI
jgi:hypothetical protein